MEMGPTSVGYKAKRFKPQQQQQGLKATRVLTVDVALQPVPRAR
jgi:hypothetical protein